jgi:hypothetical protein
MKLGLSPIMTLNTEQKGGSDELETNKVSDLFNNLVLPNWALSYHGGNNDFHKKECILYKNIIEYKNIEIAIASMIIKDKYFNLEFDIFYDDMKEIFNKNYIDLISKIEKKLDYCTIIQTKTYNMKFSINYNNLLCLIKECYNKINNKIELKI